MQTYRKTPEWV